MSRSVLLVVGLVAGGAGRHVHELAAGLASDGWSVRVACPAAVDERYGFADLDVEVVPIEIGSLPGPRDATTLRGLRSAAQGLDVVHAHGLRAGALSCLAVRDIPVAVTLHNTAPARGPQRVVFGLLERVVAWRADMVLGVSPDLLDEMRRKGAHDVRPAVVAAAPAATATRPASEIRHELGAPSVLALTVARLAPQKDLHLLFDAVAQVDSAAGLVVAVAGDGPERAALAERAAGEGLPVRLLGSRDDVPDLLAAADFVISSARWEGQPVWLQEAMRAGRPAVATDVGGTRGVVGDGGLFVPHGDPAALAAVIEGVALDTELRESLAAQADSRGRALPDRAAAVRAVEAAYDDMLRRPSGRRRRR